MDKIETALTATEDNAAAIRALNNKLNAQAEKTERLSEGSTVEVICGKATEYGLTFGEVESDGARCALIVFNDVVKKKVYFCGATVATAYSPTLVKLSAGKGELYVNASSPAYALLLASNTVFKEI